MILSLISTLGVAYVLQWIYRLCCQVIHIVKCSGTIIFFDLVAIDCAEVIVHHPWHVFSIFPLIVMIGSLFATMYITFVHIIPLSE
jgi:hypothetical protein